MPENTKIILIALLTLFLIWIILTGEGLQTENPTYYKYYIISLFFFAASVTFFNPQVGLFLLIIAMLFSPEIVVGQTERRAIVVRYDDIMIILCLLSWTITKVLKGGKLFSATPLDKPIIFFILICAVSTSRGVLIRQIGVPTKAFFYVLKLVEYFLIYYLVVNIVKSKKIVLYYLYSFLVCCCAVCYLGLKQINSGAFRISAPFEDVSEPNTFGAYLLFMFGIVFSLFIYGTKKVPRIISLGLLVMIIINFIHTLSRGSYMAFYPVMLTVVLQMPKTKKLFALVIFAAAVFSIPYLPSEVRTRVENTFKGPGSFEIPTISGSSQKISLDQSSAARVNKFQDIMTYWQEYPIFGLGITGAGFVDSQVMRTIGELGLMGVLAFIWLFKSVITEIFQIKKYFKNKFILGITAGYVGGLVGLVIHSMTANTFLIIRIMGPFWFFTGLIMCFQELYFDEIALPVSETELSEILNNKTKSSLKETA